jgi:TRAP-type C4-dicarboxylate transport system permease small subunit
MHEFSNFLTRGLVTAVAVLLAALVLLAAAETFAWTLAERSWAWASEVQGILLTWFGLLAAAWVVKLQLHLRLEVVVDRLPKRFHGTVTRFAAAGVTLFGVLLAWYGTALVSTVKNTLPATGWSASVQYVPVVVAGIMIAFYAFEEARQSPLGDDNDS